MTRTYRWARRAVWGTLVVVLSIGCNPLTMIGFLTHKDVKLPAKYPLECKEGPKKDKEEIVVAVFVTAGSVSGVECAGIDTALATEIEKTFPAMAKENKKKVTIVPLKDVNRYKVKNPSWKITPASARGHQLGADFVLDIHVTNVSYYQPGSQNLLYEGKAEVDVQLYDMERPDVPDYYPYPFAYPKTMFRDASQPISVFRREFVANLALELARQHFDHKPSSGIAEGR